MHYPAVCIPPHSLLLSPLLLPLLPGSFCAALLHSPRDGDHSGPANVPSTGHSQAQCSRWTQHGCLLRLSRLCESLDGSKLHIVGTE